MVLSRKPNDMKTLLTFFIALLSLTATQAQRICGTTNYTKTVHSSKQTAAEAKGGVRLVARDTLANELINIPVVIHVLYNSDVQNISDEQIKSQLVSLNKDFNNQNNDRVNTPAAFKSVVANCNIKFCLAQVDAMGKRTTGIERKFSNTAVFNADDAMKIESRGGIKAWNSKKYLNIWICGLNSRSLGYATSPGSAAEIDGVVIAYDVFGTIGNLRAPFNKGRTASHEVGHWLGLSHIWGDDNCGDDGVYDTPRQKSYNFGCPSFPRVTDCSETANGDMYMNFMDFVDDACMNMFTLGQKQKMRALFSANNSRNGFLTAFGCDSNAVQSGPTVTDTTIVPVVLPLQVTIYPNPTQATLNIEVAKFVSNTNNTVCIYNAIGAIVYTKQINTAKTSIQVATLPAGMYTVVINSGTEKITKKLVKQ